MRVRGRAILAWFAAAAVMLCGLIACDFQSSVYTSRAKVSEGLALAGAAKAAIVEFYLDSGRFPLDNTEAGLLPPDSFSGMYVSTIEVVPGGKIAVTYGGQEPDRHIKGRVLMLEAVGPRRDGHFTFNCLSSSIEQRHLPSVCRRENASDYRPVIFYLHGRIIEDQGPRPEHPRWGLYDYPEVVAALGGRGAAVVSEQRASGTDMDSYAEQVVAEIERLLTAEFPPGLVSVVGFSKGGGIAIRVSSRLRNPAVRYVFLAACSEGVETIPGLVPNGHVLSIVETSDSTVGTCDGLAGRNPELSAYREIAISTGKEHGAFYLPRDEWVQPVLQWAAGDKEEIEK